MRMRWVLTWKLDPEPSDGRKAKARLVILGYEDPDIESEETFAPTATRTSRQLFLQICAQRRWKIEKGDVKAAFLQGQQLKRVLFVSPTEEICDLLGIPHGGLARLCKTVYGLV